MATDNAGDTGFKPGQSLLERFKNLDHIVHHRAWRDAYHGQKPGHLLILGLLKKAAVSGKGGMRVSELASALGITASGITQMVTYLEGRGYVVRSMDPDDRRAVIVSLTGEGARLLAQARDTFEKFFAGLADYLGEEKSRELDALLVEVGRYFDGLSEASCHAHDDVQQ